MTQDLTDLIARARAATPRPWHLRERFHKTDPFEIIGNIDGDANDNGTLRMICTEVCEISDNEDCEANAAFIVAACNSAEYLATRLMRAERSLKSLVRAISDPGPMGSMYEIDRAMPDARAALTQETDNE